MHPIYLNTHPHPPVSYFLSGPINQGEKRADGLEKAIELIHEMNQLSKNRIPVFAEIKFFDYIQNYTPSNPNKKNTITGKLTMGWPNGVIAYLDLNKGRLNEAIFIGTGNEISNIKFLQNKPVSPLAINYPNGDVEFYEIINSKKETKFIKIIPRNIL